VNAVAPGFIDTEASQAIDNPLRQAQRERTPLGRFGQGHSDVLQLLGRDSPYYQASNGVFAVRVEQLSVRLPQLAK
jgi:NAD(P)-dependent dehydrogenase (short-subunit alcohol dehydrogenase family)